MHCKREFKKALHYEELEMEAFESSLRKEGNSRDLFIIKSNRWSNRYGQDWYVAGKNLFLYLLGTFCLIRLCLGYWQPNLELIFIDIAYFLNFSLNPLHKFSDIFEVSDKPFFSGLAHLLDVLARLFSGYMIFQFLQAFRKFSR